MQHHSEISYSDLHRKIRQQEVRFGGNKKLKIYGLLSCKSGKRMKRENRVFFSTEKEAIENGFRPCGHCMKSQYNKWKNGFI
ncbi:Ada metal-binding domain-containing protein [Tenacibaculum sp. TC6]|uniref:Ada metal-binding domain-containing protein n=1 Tax=Tenacibaculum sp. TC6 TaxID=3423223 RepID=UPI003D35F2CF